VTRVDVEQVFVARSGGRVELTLMLLDPIGRRTRPVHLAPTGDVAEAVGWLGRALARDATVRSVRGARLRVHRGDALRDDPLLASALDAAFRAERARQRSAS
jgi:hypothetical protein